MARGASQDSADSQFFICLTDQSYLDGKYTLWGQVISGMEYVDNIKKGNPVANGIVENPDKIISLKVLADIQE